MSSARVLRSSAVGLLLVVLGIAGLTARAVREGERQMRESDLAFNRNDLPGALVHARAAAVMYAPGAPHVGRGYERMVAIAVGAEAAGQKRVAEAAWRSVRGAALETRHACVPHRAELARANENLARLAQAPEGVESADPKLALARAKSALARDDSPSTPFMVVLVVGFVLALGGLGLVGFMGVTAEGKPALGRAKLGLALSLLGAALWTFAVYRA